MLGSIDIEDYTIIRLNFYVGYLIICLLMMMKKIADKQSLKE